MHRNWIGIAALGMAALALVPAAVGIAQAQEAEEVEQEENRVELNVVADDQPTEYWLGVACVKLDEDQRRTLQIPADQGLVVRHVAEGSPAAKAGLEVGNVLLAADGNTLSEPSDLVKGVQGSRGNDLRIVVIGSDGNRKTIAVTPEKRAAPDPNRTLNLLGPPISLRIVRPGRVLPQVALPGPHAALPDDMKVTITRQGKQPAKVVVEQGDKRFEATEDKLDDLPAEVRRHVDPMLGRFTMALGATEDVDVITFVPDPEGVDPQGRRIVRQLPRAGHRVEWEIDVEGLDATRRAAIAELQKAKAAAEERLRDVEKQLREAATQEVQETREAAESQARELRDQARRAVAEHARAIEQQARAAAEQKIQEAREVADRKVREAREAAEQALRGAARQVEESEDVQRAIDRAQRYLRLELERRADGLTPVIEQRFDELNRRLDQLQKAIESLGAQRGPVEKESTEAAPAEAPTEAAPTETPATATPEA